MVQQSRKIDSDSQSVGEILRKPFALRVPVYQRDFAWTSEQVDVFWEDITNALEQDQHEYFLGAIVISTGQNEKSRDIVGHIRINSYLMLMIG
jgi:uncharacterized protein with ParB-like and HNH nuclease domain